MSTTLECHMLPRLSKVNINSDWILSVYGFLNKHTLLTDMKHVFISKILCKVRYCHSQLCSLKLWKTMSLCHSLISFLFIHFFVTPCKVFCFFFGAFTCSQNLLGITHDSCHVSGGQTVCGSTGLSKRLESFEPPGLPQNTEGS